MRSSIRRFLGAIILSAFGFCLTYGWYFYTKPQRFELESQEALATVNQIQGQISRRQARRILWLPIESGDDIYSDEFVRTDSDGSIRLQFVNTSKYIDIEPDSVVVFAKAQNEISLDLMSGSLVVKNDEVPNQTGNEKKEEPTLILNSAAGKIDLSSASVALTGSSSKKIDLKVLSGKAIFKSTKGEKQTIEGGSQGAVESKGVEIQTQKFKSVSPLAGQTVYMNSTRPEPMRFSWQGLEPQQKITIEIGKNRSKLKTTEPVLIDGEKSELYVKLPIGKYYWQFKVLGENNEVVSTSFVQSLEILPVFAPAVVFPPRNTQLAMAKLSDGLKLQWLSDKLVQSLMLELATDPQLKQMVASANVSGMQEYVIKKINPGKYYWRLSGLAQGKHVIGKINAFSVVEEVAQAAAIPTEGPSGSRNIAAIETPKDGELVVDEAATKIIETIPLEAPKILPVGNAPLQAEANGALQINWQAASGAKEYKLSLLKPDGSVVSTTQLKTTSTRLKNLLPGEYTLNIVSINEKGLNSESSSSRSVIVPDKSSMQAPKIKKIKVN